MDTSGKRMTALRKERKITRDELADLPSISISVIGKYEQNGMTPSIKVAKNISNLLITTADHLLGKKDKSDFFKGLVTS